MNHNLAIGVLGLAVTLGSGSLLALSQNANAEQTTATEAKTSVKAPSSESEWPVSQIKSSFKKDPDLKVHDIHIEVRGESVRLQGSVNSRAEKERAEKLAKDVNGIKYVRNQLMINPDIDQEGEKSGTLETLSSIASDSAITARIKLDLLATNIDVMKVNVDTFESTVTLKGEVMDPDQKKLAEEIASSTKGVESVRNELAITNQKSK